jgi:hypothetical protein
MTSETIKVLALRGGAAGALATGAMSLAMAIAKNVGLLGEAPPRKLTRRLLRRMGVSSRGRPLDLASLAAHFGFGIAAGAAFAVAERGRASLLRGGAYGALIWAATYAGLIPKLRLMRSPEKDRPGRPTSMVVAHLVYGATLGATLARSRMTNAA